MKKTIITITTILVLLFSLLSLTACSKVPDNYKDVRSNLRKNGYAVEVGSNSEEALEIAYIVLESMIFGLDNEYSIEEGENLLSSFEEDYNDLIKDIDSCVAGMSENGEGEDFLMVVYFDDAEALETHYDIFVDVFDFLIDGTFDAEETLVDNDELEYGKSKNILYFGTAQAFKDCK